LKMCKTIKIQENARKFELHGVKENTIESLQGFIEDTMELTYHKTKVNIDKLHEEEEENTMMVHKA